MRPGVAGEPLESRQSFGIPCELRSGGPVVDFNPGAQAGEILNLLSLALSKKMTMKDLIGFIAPYPTLGELVRRAAFSYYADLPKKNWMRGVIKLLQKFG